MRLSRRAALVAMAVAALTACGGRQTEVRTAPMPGNGGEQLVQVSNNLSQAVNVYVTPAGGAELFLRQVPANTIEKVPVQGVSSGTSVTFKAVTQDGSRTYQSRSVTLMGTYSWPVP